MGKNRKLCWLVVAVIAVSAALMVGLQIIDHMQPAEQLTDEETILDYIVSENPDAMVTVGIWDNGNVEKYEYTSTGRIEGVESRYQIGSISKTFTGAMIAEQVDRGRLDIDQGSFDPDRELPTLMSLMTHRSGLADQWEQALEKDMEKTFTREELLEIAENAGLEEGKDYDFSYSNIGAAVAGTVGAQSFADDRGLSDTSYENAMNYFIRMELGLENTVVGGNGDFLNNWNWKSGDEMAAAGGIVSNVSDLLEYGQLYLSDDERHAYLKEAVKPLTGVNSGHDIGYFWIIDKDTGMIWHNGELAMDGEDGKEVGYQSFIGISPEKNRVVVVLSNAICNDSDDTAYTDYLGYILMQK